MADVSAAVPKDAVLIARFGDLGIIRHEWKIIGRMPHWNRKEWPVPQFVRIDLVSGDRYLVKYSDHLREVGTEKIPDDRARTMMAEDGLFGSGAVEIELTKRLNATARQDSAQAEVRANN